MTFAKVKDLQLSFLFSEKKKIERFKFIFSCIHKNACEMLSDSAIFKMSVLLKIYSVPHDYQYLAIFSNRYHERKMTNDTSTTIISQNTFLISIWHFQNNCILWNKILVNQMSETFQFLDNIFRIGPLFYLKVSYVQVNEHSKEVHKNLWQEKCTLISLLICLYKFISIFLNTKLVFHVLKRISVKTLKQMLIKYSSN